MLKRFQLDVLSTAQNSNKYGGSGMLNFTCAIRALLVRFFVFVSCLVAFLPNAWAERYIISFKNPSDFNQVHSQYVLMNSSTVQKMFSRPSPVQVTDSLKNLKAVIVSSPDKALCKH